MKQDLLQNKGKLAIAAVFLFFLPSFLWMYLSHNTFPEESKVTESSEKEDSSSGVEKNDRAEANSEQTNVVMANTQMPLGPSTRVDTTSENSEVVTEEVVSSLPAPFRKKKAANVFDVTEFFQRENEVSPFDASELQDRPVLTQTQRKTKTAYVTPVSKLSIVPLVTTFLREETSINEESERLDSVVESEIVEQEYASDSTITQDEQEEEEPLANDAISELEVDDQPIFVTEEEEEPSVTLPETFDFYDDEPEDLEQTEQTDSIDEAENSTVSSTDEPVEENEIENEDCAVTECQQ